MFKKMLSTLIAALLLLSAFAVMPAMAAVDEVGTAYYRDDFENYRVGDIFNSGANAGITQITDKDGNYNWYTGAYVGAEIVSFPDSDGNDNTALKVFKVATSSKVSDGGHRLNFTAPSGATIPTSGIAVTEISIYQPEEYGIRSFTSSTLRMGDSGAPIGYDMHKNESGTNVYHRVGDYEYGTWIKIKFVHDIDAGTLITYINDVMTTYHKWDPAFTLNEETGVASGVFPGRLNSLSMSGELGREYLLLDDINYYYAPAATTVTATYPANEATGVTFATNPTVTFTHPLMNVVGDVSVGTDVEVPTTVVTTENVTVEVIECADESKLGEVEVEEVALSNSNKTLEIKPAVDLPGGATVQVTVSGLKDDMDREIAETSFTFTTMEEVNLTGAPVFKKENLMMSNGTEIDTLQNGYISCNYELTNGSTTSDVNILYFAVLKVNDVVESFQFMPATVAANGGKASFYGGFNVKDAANSKIEVYVWDGFENMASLVPMVTFDAE